MRKQKLKIEQDYLFSMLRLIFFSQHVPKQAVCCL